MEYRSSDHNGPKSAICLGGRFADPIDTFEDVPSVVDMVACHAAARRLRQALDAFSTRERQCVVSRLCRRMSFERIARDLRMPAGDVCDILSRTRSRVRTYTTHFDSDWYWPDTTGPAAHTVCV